MSEEPTWDDYLQTYLEPLKEQIDKLKNAKNCQLWGVCENQKTEIKGLTDRIEALENADKECSETHTKYQVKFINEIAELKELLAEAEFFRVRNKEALREFSRVAACSADFRTFKGLMKIQKEKLDDGSKTMETVDIATDPPNIINKVINSSARQMECEHAWCETLDNKQICNFCGEERPPDSASSVSHTEVYGIRLLFRDGHFEDLDPKDYSVVEKSNLKRLISGETPLNYDFYVEMKKKYLGDKE